MKSRLPSPPSLAGTILVANPQLEDENFRRTVILLSLHSQDQGAMGLVLNRPVGKTLGELRPAGAVGDLRDVPLYLGGPVEADKLLLFAWRWDEEQSTVNLFFAITVEKATRLREEFPDIEIRGFLGYSGWGKGQLENELKQDTWFLAGLDGSIVQEDDNSQLYVRLLTQSKPDMGFFFGGPEDSSQN